MHFTGLACTKFSEKTENAKITKFSIPLNLVTLRYHIYMYKAIDKVYCTADFKCFNYLLLSCGFPALQPTRLNKMCENQKYVSSVVHSNVPAQ